MLSIQSVSMHLYRNKSGFWVTRCILERTTFRYMEVGHAIQNAYLQAISLGLGSVVIGAFNDTEMKHAMKLDYDEQPLLLLPVGKHRDF